MLFLNLNPVRPGHPGGLNLFLLKKQGMLNPEVSSPIIIQHSLFLVQYLYSSLTSILTSILTSTLTSTLTLTSTSTLTSTLTSQPTSHPALHCSSPSSHPGIFLHHRLHLLLTDNATSLAKTQGYERDVAEKQETLLRNKKKGRSSYCIDFMICATFSFNSGISFLIISQTKPASTPKYS
jgi:hypothetical protein